MVDVRPHGWVLAWPLGLAGLAVVIAAVGAWARVPRAAAWVLIGLVAVGLAQLLARYARWRATSLVVTTQRVVRRSGILARRGQEIPLAQIADVSYRQGLFQRLIRAGDVRIEAAGRDDAEVFHAVPRPAAVEREIIRLLAERRAGGGVLSLPEQLARLDDLRRSGVLSPAEFEASKARLLGR